MLIASWYEPYNKLDRIRSKLCGSVFKYLLKQCYQELIRFRPQIRFEVLNRIPTDDLQDKNKTSREVQQAPGTTHPQSGKLLIDDPFICFVARYSDISNAHIFPI